MAGRGGGSNGLSCASRCWWIGSRCQYTARRRAARRQTAQKQQEPRSRLPVWCEIRAVSDGLRAALLLDLRPGVAQRHGAVEDRSVLSRVGIDAEVPLPLELVERARRGAAHARL